MKKLLSGIVGCALMSAVAAGAAETVAYVIPGQVAGTNVGAAAEEAVLKLMETPVAAETFASWKKANPAPFHLFGEERRLAVRNGIVPAHWFAEGGPARVFRGKAQPGEYYVFQVCVASEKARALVWAASPAADAVTPARCAVKANGVKPIWVGVNVPCDAAGKTLTGVVEVKDAATGEAARLPYELAVSGEVLKDGGIHDAWRLARLQWLNSTVGTSETEPTRPFTPVAVNEATRTLSILGRDLVLGENGLPTHYFTRFNGSNAKILAEGTDALSRPFDFRLDGKTPLAGKSTFTFLKRTPCAVSWRATTEAGEACLEVEGRLEFDGFAEFKMNVVSKKEAVSVSPVFTVAMPAARGRFQMGLGREGGFFPAKHEWTWNPNRHQDATWVGDVNGGMMFRFKGANFSRPLINAYYAWKKLNMPETWAAAGGGIVLEKTADAATLRAHGGPLVVTAGAPARYAFDLYLTPFKPANLKMHLADRYFHYSQHGTKNDFNVRKDAGATVINLHHNTIWNPYINYPYNDDGGPHLKEALKEMHALGLRGKVYYTTRELTQNLPEFFALKSLDGEIFMPRNPAVKGWPVTNRNGPHPWLAQHVGTDIIPAWRENVRFSAYPNRLDLAVITTPDTRWNNFYLGGLDYLVREFKIDGLYIDDTALNREAMMRARRILDADGNTGRRIDMHSWNHRSGLAGGGNSSIVFMELYPYYDRLWHGEGFSAQKPPEYWLVEMSGIPYGLMSEMLHGFNQYRGMVFGMTCRGGWQRWTPYSLWKFFQEESLEDAELVGWWDEANPVALAGPGAAPIRATVYKFKDRAVVALANFSNTPQQVTWNLDCAKLGWAGRKVACRIPAIDRFQEKEATAPGGTLDINVGNGRLIVVRAE